MKFETISKADRVYASSATINYRRRFTTLHFRLDGRGDTYRVDCMKPLFPAWEAIDGGNGFNTLAEAKQHVAKWVAAVKAQETLSPSISK